MKKILLFVGLLIMASSFGQQKHPEFMNQGNIYEVNIRQYTKEGTFKAFAKHLPRLQKMGVQTIWFMPIQPISKFGRKGSLGSYYAVASYTDINPEFGTLADFNATVDQAHAHGMKVLIDYVPNHSGADHPWLTTHPDFYETDSTGKPTYTADWSDTRELNYNNLVMQDSMINTMKYWLNATKIDGFRVDVAWGVPYSFWNKCIPALKGIRNIYLLAEADDAKLHETGFDATYTWKEFHVLNDIAAGRKNIFSLDTVLQNIEKEFMQGAQRLYFTSNHDENSWNKADYATMPGAIHTPFAVFTQTYNRTMPLIYSGQEEPVLRPLAFFEKDSIEFKKYERANFYMTLLKLRKSNAAFADNANFKRLKVNLPGQIMAYERTNGQDKVVVVLNLSNQPQKAIIEGVAPASFEEIFTKQKVSGIQSLPMTAWGYQVFVKKN
ncbi:MAG: alpha-amylase family glycosyl hydrolase [Sphingomonadales bacterium]